MKTVPTQMAGGIRVWFGTSMNAKCLIRNPIERIGQRQTTSGGNGVVTVNITETLYQPKAEFGIFAQRR